MPPKIITNDLHQGRVLIVGGHTAEGVMQIAMDVETGSTDNQPATPRLSLPCPSVGKSCREL